MSCKNVYVLGPSGAGKGTLIDKIMAHCLGNEIGNFITANGVANKDSTFLRARGNLSDVTSGFLAGRSSIDQVQLAWVDYFMQRDKVVQDTYLNNPDVDASNMVMIWDRNIVEVDDYNTAYCSAGLMDALVAESICDIIIHHLNTPNCKLLKADKAIYLQPGVDELIKRLTRRNRDWDRWAIENDVVCELYKSYRIDLERGVDILDSNQLVVIEGEYDVEEIVEWIND